MGLFYLGFVLLIRPSPFFLFSLVIRLLTLNNQDHNQFKKDEEQIEKFKDVMSQYHDCVIYTKMRPALDFVP